MSGPTRRGEQRRKPDGRRRQGENRRRPAEETRRPADEQRDAGDVTAHILDLLEQRRSGDGATRTEVERKLSALRVDPNLLQEALRHRRASVREAALDALANMAGNAEALPEAIIAVLLTAADDNYPFVCAAALRALGRHRVESGREVMLRCLGDAHAHVRSAAILGLARIGAADVAPQIATFLDGDESRVRIAAAQAVGMLGYRPAIPNLIGLLDDLLLELAGGSIARSRPADEVMEALTRLNARESIPLLLTIAHEARGLRTAAVRALRILDARDTLPSLVNLLNDQSESLIREVIRFVEQANYRPAREQIRVLEAHASPAVRRAASATLLTLDLPPLA